MDAKLIILTSPEEFCRLCLEQHQIYYPLFETIGAQMLESLTSMKISVDDPAPNFACRKCFLELAQAYNIQQRLIATETSLQEKFTTINVPIKEEPFDECGEADNIQQRLTASETSVQWKFTTGTHVPIKEEPIDVKSPQHECGDQCNSSIQTDALPERCEHLKKLKKTESVKCRLCPKEIPADNYRTHLATHSDGFCKYCGRTFKDQHSLRVHVLQNHQQPVRCSECDLEFGNVKAYDLHVTRVHTGKATYICETCGRQFFTITTLKGHIKHKHLGMDKWPCEVCGRNFRKNDLVRHRLVHSGEKPFICEFCGQGFTLKSNMNLHKTKVHGWKDDVNYKCGMCEKGFSSYFALSVHMKIHSKNKV